LAFYLDYGALSRSWNNLTEITLDTQEND